MAIETITMQEMVGPVSLRVSGETLEAPSILEDGAGNVFLGFMYHLGNDTYYQVYKNYRRSPNGTATYDAAVTFAAPLDTTNNDGLPKKMTGCLIELDANQPDIVAIATVYERPDASQRRNHYVEIGRWSGVAVPRPEGGGGGFPRVVTIPPTPSFNDIPAGSPFYRYVEALHALGAIGGYDDGTFRPGNPLTRAQLCKILVVALENAGVISVP